MGLRDGGRQCETLCCLGVGGDGWQQDSLEPDSSQWASVGTPNILRPAKLASAGYSDDWRPAGFSHDDHSKFGTHQEGDLVDGYASALKTAIR